MKVRVCDTKVEFLISRSKTVLANQMQMGEEREGGGGANLRLTNTLASRMCDTPSRLLHINSRGATAVL